LCVDSSQPHKFSNMTYPLPEFFASNGRGKNFRFPPHIYTIYHKSYQNNPKKDYNELRFNRFYQLRPDW
jgi:hypothetical protein